MSNQRLPAELLDHIIDLLHDSKNALENCCLVSKSWVPRARKHLFADIEFSPTKSLKSWKAMFPNPSTSPACYAKALLVKYPLAVGAPDAEEWGWISTFTCIEHFEADTFRMDADLPPVSLVPFYGLPPCLKSLHLSFRVVPSSQVFGLIYSFPLLEDLSLTSSDRWIGSNDGSDDQSTAFRSSVPPAFTGRLELNLETGLDFVVSRLSSLRGGLPFRRLRLTLNGQKDALPVTALVERCRFTLEYLEIVSDLYNQPLLESIDLSKATELKDLVLVCESNPKWITMALQTITRDHRKLQRVSIVTAEVLYPLGFSNVNSSTFIHAMRETTYRAWLDLDCLLSQFSETHSIRPEVLYNAPDSVDEEEARSSIEYLLPQLIKRGLVELAQREDEWFDQ